MRNTVITAVLLICLLLPTVLQAVSLSDVGTLEDRVEECVLDNGLKVVVVERHMAPVFFTLITFRVGSCQELPNHSGLSHFLEHMLFKGTKSTGTRDYEKEKPIMEELERAAGEIRNIRVVLKPWRLELFDEHATTVKASLPQEVREVIGSDEAAGWRTLIDQLPTDVTALPEDWCRTPWLLADREHNYWELYLDLIDKRAQLADLIVKQRQYIVQTELGGIYDEHGARRMNAFTSTDQTTYMVGLPSNCLELWMFLESDRFRNPVFREFYSEREVVMEELRMGENDPDDVMYETLVKTAFTAHPYGRPIIGWMSDIKLTTSSDMEEHFRRYYAPNNCQLTIVGDVDTEEALRLAERYFGTWPPSELAHEVTVFEPEQNGERRVTVEHDSEPQLRIGFHVPVAPHPDAYALVMANFVLSFGRTSRFYRSIFVEQGLTGSSPSCWSEPGDRYPNLLIMNAKPKGTHTLEEVEAAILMELEKLKEEPVTQRELERVKNRLNMWKLDRLRSNYRLAFSLSSAFTNRGDWRTITEDFDRLMAVTAEDVQRVVRKYFTAKNRTVATLVRPAVEQTGEAAQVGG